MATGEFCLEAWIYISVASKINVIVSQTLQGFSFYVNASNKLEFAQANVSVRLTGSSTLYTDTWYFVAATRDSGTLRLFLDGALEGSVANTNNFTGVDTGVGGYTGAPTNSTFRGYIDEVRVTKGHARYISAFTAPTEAFSDARSALVEISGPLQSPAATGAYLVGGYTAVSGPLGSPAVLARRVIAAVVAVPSPLAAALVLALHDFTSLIVGDRPIYVMDLTTPSGLVRAPISSWQATLQVDFANYVQCVIPACEPYIDDINAATAFTIYRRAVFQDGSFLEYVMASAPTGLTSISRGTSNYTAVISGYGAALPAVEEPPEALDRQLQDVRAIFSQPSGLRVRCGVDWLLRPAQRALLGATSFVVSYINYYVSDGDQYMDVGERVA